MQARPRPVFITTEPRQPTLADLNSNTADEIIDGLFLGNATSSVAFYQDSYERRASTTSIVSCIPIAENPFLREKKVADGSSINAIDSLGKILIECKRHQILDRKKLYQQQIDARGQSDALASEINEEIQNEWAKLRVLGRCANQLLEGEIKQRVLNALSEVAKVEDALSPDDVLILQNKIVELNKQSQSFCHIPFGDVPNPNSLPKMYLDHTYEFIDKALNEGRRVLVHCSAGASRSPAIVIGYLMRKYQLDFETAEKHVRNKRPVVNTSFRLRLQNYLPCPKLINQVGTLLDKFPSSPLTQQKADIWEDFMMFHKANLGNPHLITRSMIVESWAHDYSGRHNGENPFITLNKQRRTGFLSLFNPARTASTELFHKFMAEDWKNTDSRFQITRDLRDEDHDNRNGFTQVQLSHLGYELPVSLQLLMDETEQPQLRRRLAN